MELSKALNMIAASAFLVAGIAWFLEGNQRISMVLLVVAVVFWIRVFNNKQDV